jgi:hypothetical protein
LVLGEGGEREVEVYVSWNGDTETRTWWFYLVDGEGVEKGILGKVGRTGFETVLKVQIDAERVGSEGILVAAEARDEQGKVLGRSGATRVSDRGLYNSRLGSGNRQASGAEGPERLDL